MQLTKMIARSFAKQYLVYELPSDWQPLPQHLQFPSPVVAQCADRDVIERLFSAEPSRRNTFLRFLEGNSIGLICSIRERWVAYAWISPPGVPWPDHLPRAVRATPAYWIHYCRTRDDYRGQGLYKRSIAVIAGYTRHQDPQARVLIDTGAENLPSRRAVLAVGFNPRGVIRTYRVWVPKLGSLIWGAWDLSAAHPLLP